MRSFSNIEYIAWRAQFADPDADCGFCPSCTQLDPAPTGGTITNVSYPDIDTVTFTIASVDHASQPWQVITIASDQPDECIELTAYSLDSGSYDYNNHVDCSGTSDTTPPAVGQERRYWYFANTSDNPFTITCTITRV
jgi:hypothetical protein